VGTIGRVLHLKQMRFSKTSIRTSAVVAAALVLQSVAAAGPMKFSSPCDVPGLRQAILDQVNAARARGWNCGGQRFAAAAPLGWNERLVSAATGHSKDMAERNYFDHRSPDGLMVSQRASASKYNWKTVAENIAGGDTTVHAVVQGWLQSPEHCVNIMEPAFTEIGVACMQQPGSQWGTYCTMVLGRPR
jgi:uncharacterized protein YkwD